MILCFKIRIGHLKKFMILYETYIFMYLEESSLRHYSFQLLLAP